jgi:hypothetical protein
VSRELDREIPRCVHASQLRGTDTKPPVTLPRSNKEMTGNLETHEVRCNTFGRLWQRLGCLETVQVLPFSRPMTNFRLIGIARHNFVCTRNMSIGKRTNKENLQYDGKKTTIGI